MRKSILSKRKYAAALKTLSKTRDFTKISVTDICAGCGLSRKGFYYHFADKFLLVAWILQHEFCVHLAGWPCDMEPILEVPW